MACDESSQSPPYRADAVRLVHPHARYGDAYLDMLREFERAGFEKYGELLELAASDLDAHLAMLADLAKGVPRPPFAEPRKTYWAAEGEDRLVAIARFRLWLGDPAGHPWGHIGLDVVPSARSRGVAGSFLTQVVREAWSLGMESLLVKAHEDNDHSIRLILGCGARHLDGVTVHPDGERYRHFTFEREA